MLQSKILFFIPSSVATKEQIEEAESINGIVCFRNAALINNHENTENCDFVMGCIPESYLKYPKFGVKIEEVKEAIEPVIKPKSKKETVSWSPNA